MLPGSGMLNMLILYAFAAAHNNDLVLIPVGGRAAVAPP